jgi:hypothetical protein
MSDDKAEFDAEAEARALWRRLRYIKVWSHELSEAQQALEVAYQRGRTDERRECAKVAEKYAEAAGPGYEMKTSKRKTAECIAAAIREARGEEKP